MNLATLRGRLQTKLLTYSILTLVTIVFTLLYGTAYLYMFTIAVFVGLVLETSWGWLIEHEPGWLTFLLGGVEFLLIVGASFLLKVPVTFTSAATFYFTNWIITQLFLLYALPVWHTSWLEDGSELW